MMVVAIYVLSMILSSVTTDKTNYIFWLRWLWWASVFPSILWLHTTFLLFAEEHLNNEIDSITATDEPSSSFFGWLKHEYFKLFGIIPLLPRLGIFLFYLSAFIFSFWGTFSNFILNYDLIRFAAKPWSRWAYFFTPKGDGYGYFTFYVITGMIFAGIILALALGYAVANSSKISKYILLIIGTLLFGLAAFILTFINLEVWKLPEAAGHLVLAVGIFIAGFAIIRDNSSFEGRQFMAGFWSLLLTLFPLLVLFIVVFIESQPHPSTVSLTLQVTIIVVSALFYGQIRRFWEWVFLDPRLNQIKEEGEQQAARARETHPDRLDQWIAAYNSLSDDELKVLETYAKSSGNYTYYHIQTALSMTRDQVDFKFRKLRSKFGVSSSPPLVTIWKDLSALQTENENPKPSSTESEPVKK